ncbi:MAG: calcium/sodium antiporter [Anaerolineae bacterium]|nr:calcium/sodium antiporter [Anaerolineae bacterium]
MFQDGVLILLGLVALVVGASWLVKGAARIAQAFGVSPLVIGLTVVAFGTSAPELVVSVSAALRDASDIAVGNVVGSNIFNIAVVLGVSALLYPVRVDSVVLRRDIPLMIGVSVALWLVILDGELSRLEGMLFVAGLFIYTAWLLRASGPGDPLADSSASEVGALLATRSNLSLEFGRAALGVGGLVLGANLMIEGAVGIARGFGVSELVIGLTLVAGGTSLPELATSAVAALRKESDIAVGNVVGSNLFNILWILGLSSVIRPIAVAENVVNIDALVMIAVALLLVPFALRQQLGRPVGVLFGGGLRGLHRVPHRSREARRAGWGGRQVGAGRATGRLGAGRAIMGALDGENI